MGVVRTPTVIPALMLSFLVTGARADNTLTALIVSSCITGLLLLLAVLGAVIYCVVKYNKKQIDQTNKAPPTPTPNGYYRPTPESPSPRTRAKAYTQHAVPPGSGHP